MAAIIMTSQTLLVTRRNVIIIDRYLMDSSEYDTQILTSFNDDDGSSSVDREKTFRVEISVEVEIRVGVEITVGVEVPAGVPISTDTLCSSAYF